MVSSSRASITVDDAVIGVRQATPVAVNHAMVPKDFASVSVNNALVPKDFADVSIDNAMGPIDIAMVIGHNSIVCSHVHEKNLCVADGRNTSPWSAVCSIEFIFHRQFLRRLVRPFMPKPCATMPNASAYPKSASACLVSRLACPNTARYSAARARVHAVCAPPRSTLPPSNALPPLCSVSWCGTGL